MEFKSIVRMTFFGGSTGGCGEEREAYQSTAMTDGLEKRNAGIMRKMVLIMKLTTVLVFAFCLHATANGYTQGITITVKNQPLPKVFKEIEKQTGYSFLYHTGQINQTKTVTLNVVNETLDRVLQICLKDQPFDYKIVNKVIVVKPKAEAEVKPTAAIEKGKRINISGKVTGEQGEPVIGATISIKGGDASTTTTTNEKGE
ncbi:MAG TPA: secretin and TonB N-terminal domain-containing protein, partial [Niastella sp.]